MLHLEGLAPLRGSGALLRSFHRLGIRSAQPTWNMRNALADGVGEPIPAGLSERGRELILELSELGTLIDVSHLAPARLLGSRRDAYDGPIVASHANAAAVWPHPRNLEDDQIWAIASSGGVIGACFFPAFIGEEPGLGSLLDHVDHIVDLVGVEHVAMGPDYVDFARDLMIADMTYGSAGSRLRQRLRLPRGHALDRDAAGVHGGPARAWLRETDIAKIIGGNALRVLRAVLADLAERRRERSTQADMARQARWRPALSLEGRHAVVTGAGRGIGAQTARELASLGASVSLLDLIPSSAPQGVAAELVAERGTVARAFACDVADPSVGRGGFRAVASAASSARHPRQQRRRDLVRAVPRNDRGGLGHSGRHQPHRHVSVLACRAPAMRERSWGRIVNISSIAGKRGGGFLGRTPYSAAKAGVLGFTKALAREVAADGITVNAIAPGPMDTDMTKILREDDALLERIVANVPLGRRGLPYEVADAVCALCSGVGSYMTGETLNVDGGVAME